MLHSTIPLEDGKDGEPRSHPHTRLTEQTNSGASHFRPPMSCFWPSETVQAKSNSTVHLEQSNLTWRRVSQRSETGVVSIRALGSVGWHIIV